MKILVFGGTHFTGRETVKILRKNGHAVTTFSRVNVPPEPAKAGEHIVGDRLNETDLKKALKAEKWDVVVDNLAFKAKDIQAMLAHLTGKTRYIFNSSVAVYRNRLSEFIQPFQEDSVDYDKPEAEKNPHTEYARNKREAEKVLISQKKVPWTILRPPVIYGPNDSTNRSAWYFLRLLDGAPVLLADSGYHSFRMVFSRDVARAFVAVIESEKAIGEAYNVAQQEIITLRKFLELSATYLGKKPRFVPIPWELVGEPLAGPYSNMPNYIVDPKKLQDHFNFVPSPFEETLKETTKWFLDYWKGDRKTLLESRTKEMAFAQRWERSLELLRGPILDPLF